MLLDTLKRGGELHPPGYLTYSTKNRILKDVHVGISYINPFGHPYFRSTPALARVGEGSRGLWTNLKTQRVGDVLHLTKIFFKYNEIKKK